MLGPGGARVGCVLVTVLLGCEPDVRIVDSTGGGGSDSSVGGDETGGHALGAGGDGGGGAPPAPRLIEVDYGETPGRVLLVNDAGGALKQSLPLEREAVQVEVTDGDLVSILDEEDTHLRSFRVTPEVTRISDGPSPFPALCEPDPMRVTLVFPAIEGAFRYDAFADGYGHTAKDEAGEAVMQVQSCTDTFDVLAAAHDGWGRIVRYELVRGLPFTAGGSLTVPLTLASAERSSFSVTLVGLDGVTTMGGEVSWRGDGFIMPQDRATFIVDDVSGTHVHEATPIFPAAGYGHNLILISSVIGEEGDERCDKQVLIRRQGNESFEYAPLRLAGIRPSADGSWTFEPDGELGDVVSQLWTFEQDYAWYVVHDASRPPEVPVFPELPAGTRWPAGAPSLINTAHSDAEERDGYAAVLGEPEPLDASSTLTRSWGECPY